MKIKKFLFCEKQYPESKKSYRLKNTCKRTVIQNIQELLKISLKKKGQSYTLYKVIPPIFQVPTCHHSYYNTDYIPYAVFLLPQMQ